jgi:transglutaminase superfamily protein
VAERAIDAPSLLRRIGALTWSERVVIVQAALLIAGLRAALRVCGVRRVQKGLAAFVSSMSDVTDADRERGLAMSRLVDVAARHTVRNTCLHRSLALWWLLGRRGVPSRIRIGTRRRRRRRFEAHAWVEIGGVAINDRGEPGYAALVWPPVEHDA